jgi:hypothetical protein
MQSGGYLRVRMLPLSPQTKSRCSAWRETA